MKWDTACRAIDDLFWAFLSPGTQEPLLHFHAPEEHFFSLGSWKKYTLSIHPKKDNHPSPYPEKRFCTSLQIWDGLIVFGRLSRGFVVISRASNFRFSWNCSRLGLLTIVRANSLSCLFCVYVTFFKTILAALFRAISLPLLFLSSKPSFLDDHFTNPTFGFFQDEAVSCGQFGCQRNFLNLFISKLDKHVIFLLIDYITG